MMLQHVSFELFQRVLLLDVQTLHLMVMRLPKIAWNVTGLRPY